jgi:hypothetical protein
MLKEAIPPKLWYGLSVGRRQSYHLPFSTQTEETWCLRGAAEDVEVLVEVEDRGEDMLVVVQVFRVFKVVIDVCLLDGVCSWVMLQIA